MRMKKYLYLDSSNNEHAFDEPLSEDEMIGRGFRFSGWEEAE